MIVYIDYYEYGGQDVYIMNKVDNFNLIKVKIYD